MTVPDDDGPLGPLPRLTWHQARLEERLGRLDPGCGIAGWLSDLTAPLGPIATADRPELRWRASGLGRPGLIARLSWPRLATRLGLGVETSVVHAVVDRLLGYGRDEGASELPPTPVETGILTYFLARALTLRRGGLGPLGPCDLTLDRVATDPFDPRGLGPMATLIWPIRIGATGGVVRLWSPQTLAARWLAAEAIAPIAPTADWLAARGALASVWCAEAGVIDLPRGLGRLRVGGVQPLGDSTLRGTPQSPTGRVLLASDPAPNAARRWFPAEPAPLSGGGRLIVTGPMQGAIPPREALAVNPTADPTPTTVPPLDVPVTLTVELGRVNLTLQRLADLRPGDVLDLGRHSREPVELTSNGRLVARGELVLIDTELGVRITSVFL